MEKEIIISSLSDRVKTIRSMSGRMLPSQMVNIPLFQDQLKKELDDGKIQKCYNLLLVVVILERVSSLKSFSFTIENVSERVKKVFESVKHFGYYEKPFLFDYTTFKKNTFTN